MSALFNIMLGMVFVLAFQGAFGRVFGENDWGGNQSQTEIRLGWAFWVALVLASAAVITSVGLSLLFERFP